ncbi:MAG: hypothetical protein HY735_02470 [Verrucomicrobia bacterium]|nr:hypothetical protein [Verrucomicrobiota bacterium]
MVFAWAWVGSRWDSRDAAETVSPSFHRPFSPTQAEPQSREADQRAATATPLEETLTMLAAEVGDDANPISREEKMQAFVGEVPAERLPEAVRLLSQWPPSEIHRELVVRLLRQWTACDPKEAAAWALSVGHDPFRHEAVEQVAIVWAEGNLTDALNWAVTLPGGEERTAACRALAGEAAREAPIAAMSIALELPASPQKNQLIASVASEWAVRDVFSAVSWAREIGDAGLREAVTAAVCQAIAETNPAAAATIAIHDLAAGRNLDDTVLAVLQRWAQVEPKRAVDWVERFPEGILRQAATEELIKVWADQQPREVSDWLNSLPAGTRRDEWAGLFAAQIVRLAPGVAMDWAESISDPASRNRQSEAVALAWLDLDPATARERLAQSALPDETKQRLLLIASEGVTR